ncbi:MAG: exodeoxyribonuclease VII small subunit [Campylobacteraceae bacterium]|jgi:exodeoxyribonuclease VII small subunit|nr:exodeoxyribonuclease VII small subunit [Campylobacteraceae bacterium]
MSEKKSFETELEEAKELLKELSNPEITLEKSVEVYKEGIKKLESASKMLEEAKLQIEEFSKKDA